MRSAISSEQSIELAGDSTGALRKTILGGRVNLYGWGRISKNRRSEMDMRTLGGGEGKGDLTPPSSSTYEIPC